MTKIKLNQIEKQRFTANEMNNVKGGQIAGMWSWKFDDQGNIVGIKCQCSCKYAFNGGSSTYDNYSANDAKNLHSER